MGTNAVQSPGLSFRPPSQRSAGGQLLQPSLVKSSIRTARSGPVENRSAAGAQGAKATKSAAAKHILMVGLIQQTADYSSPGWGPGYDRLLTSAARNRQDRPGSI